MATRDEILASAQRHLNVDPRASMAELATAAGVGRATLHRHFATRDDLLHELGTRSLDRWEQSMDAARTDAVAAGGDPVEVEACVRELFGRYLADADDFGFALTDSYLTSAPELVRRADRLAGREVDLLAAAQSAGVLRDDVPARWLTHAVYGLLVAAREAVREGDVARRDLDALVLTTFLKGVSA